MAYLPESDQYDAGVYQKEITDSVLGGVAGKANAAEINLSNRTTWLKARIDEMLALVSMATHVADTDPHPQYLLNSEVVGFVLPFASSTVPAGFLECNGSAISRSAYAALFAAISTTFGVGDGSTTFNLPDLRSEFIRGWDNGHGIDNNRSFASFQAEKAGTVTISTALFYATPGSIPCLDVFVANGKIWNDNTAAQDVEMTAHDTRPRNIALMYCINY